jgi:hypothetical protein
LITSLRRAALDLLSSDIISPNMTSVNICEV